jgi:hypothetical protein
MKKQRKSITKLEEEKGTTENNAIILSTFIVFTISVFT